MSRFQVFKSFYFSLLFINNSSKIMQVNNVENKVFGFYISIALSFTFCLIFILISIGILFKNRFKSNKTKQKTTSVFEKCQTPFIVLTTIQPEFDKCSGLRRFTEPNNHLKLSSVMDNDKRRFSDNETCKGRIDMRKESFQPDRFSLSSVDKSYNFFNSLILSRLHFTISFNDSAKIMYVNIKKVNNVSCTFEKTINCSIKVEVYDERSNRIYSSVTATVTSMGNPIFEQTLAFEVHSTFINLWSLRFFILKREKKINKNIGSVAFSLDCLSPIRSPNMDQEFSRMITYDFKNPENKGIVLVSVSFHKELDKYIVSVGIIRALNLPLDNNDNGVFAKMIFMDLEQEIKSERTITIKTDIKNPLFPLAQFSHEISESSLSKTWLVVNVCGRNVFGISRIIGRCLFGPIAYSDRDGSSHWSDAITLIDRVVYKWHGLKV